MALREVVLVALTSGEMSGYDIAGRFDRRLSFVWHATHQQIYRELKALERDGLIRHRVVGQAQRPDKKLYRLTVEGERALHARLLDDAAARPARVKDPLLVKCFAGEHMPAAEMRRQIRLTRDHYRERLEVLQEIETTARRQVPEPTAGQMMAYLALRRGISAARGWIEWADEADRALSAYE